MIKKIILVLLLVIFLSSCSVQKNMSPTDFFDDLSKINNQLDFEKSEMFYENDRFICFINDINGYLYVYEIEENELGDIIKISLACDKTDKTDMFLNLIDNVISIISPDENINEINSYLTVDGKFSNGFKSYELKWYDLNVFSDKNGIYFSMTDKKYYINDETQLTLKPNDRVDF